jgi:hypothetical protein
MPAPRVGSAHNNARNLMRAANPVKPGDWRLPRFAPRPNAYRKGPHMASRSTMRKMRRL